MAGEPLPVPDPATETCKSDHGGGLALGLVCCFLSKKYHSLCTGLSALPAAGREDPAGTYHQEVATVLEQSFSEVTDVKEPMLLAFGAHASVAKNVPSTEF